MTSRWLRSNRRTPSSRVHVLDLPAERGRGDAQLFGGTGEMTVAGDAEEVAEMADFHGCYLQGNDASRRG
ncbi:hypothetical protein PPS11_17566 [Pseudomonas putida S11]|nr:hypothetical protein PPS11_17566 [Pseudomonas putida S11]